jgi:hypothetical protein
MRGDGVRVGAMIITVNIRTVAGQNVREHFAVRAKRVKAEKEAVAWSLVGKEKPPIPCSVRLTRVAPSAGVDDDNLVGAMKAVRDAVAAWLGVDDKHSRQVRYVYDQKRGPWGLTIEFGEPVAGAQFTLLGAAA